jgi:Putative zinc-finger
VFEIGEGIVMKHLDEDLSAYISGELNEGRRLEVEMHLKECDSCSRELSRLQNLHAILGEAEQREPSAHFTEKVLDVVKQPPKTSFLKNRKRIAWLALAASVAAAVFILNLGRNFRSSVPAQNNPTVAKLQKKQEPPVVTRKEEKPVLVQTKPVPKKEVMPPSTVEIAKNEKSLSPEEVELIANLDTLENMDLILNYEDVDHMETAVVANDEESTQ